MTQFINITDVDTLELDRMDSDHPDDWPFYIMIAGGMGAGKTHIINQYIEHVDIFDIDSIMEQNRFLDYSEDQFAIAMKEIAEKIEEQFKKRNSMVAMGTASNPTAAIDRLYAAKLKGFRTILIHIDAPVYQAVIQNRLRVEKGERGVKESDEHKIERTTNGAVRTVSILRESSLVDYFVYYNNHRDIIE